MSDLKSLNSLFTERIYRIPDYQRGYAWTEKELKDFWEDVVNLPENNSHYTGMITIKCVEEHIYKTWNEENWLIKDKRYKPYYVVDGQQRLTTCIVFIKAFIDLVLSLQSDKNEDDIYIKSIQLKDIKEKYIFEEKKPEKIIKTYKFGYEKDNPSFEYLRYKIFDENNKTNVQETYYTRNLSNAKEFFEICLKDYYNQNGKDKVEDLFDKVTHRLMFNCYEISKDFDVFVAFETMNNRGRALSKLELLKNRLIYLITLSDSDNDEKDNLRKTINKAWQNIYSNLGKNKDKLIDADEFLKGHWISFFKFSRNTGDDYINYLLKDKFVPCNIINNYATANYFRNNINEEQELSLDSDEFEENEDYKSNDSYDTSLLTLKEIENYVLSLSESSLYWLAIKYPEQINDISILSVEEEKWLNKLNRLGIAYFRPLILASFMNNNIMSEERIILLKNIERFIFLNFKIGRAQSNFKSSFFQRTAKDLKDGKVQISMVCDALNIITESWLNTTTGFNCSSFNDYIQRLYNDNKGFYGWGDLKYFLYEYECEKVEKNGNPKIDWDKFIKKNEKDKFSIEHILPQTPDDNYWQKNFNGYTEKELMYLTNSLGNLLPLSQQINSGIQNKPYNPDKMKRFAEGAYNTIEVATNFKEWTPENILTRGILMLDFMERRWNLKFKDIESKKELLHLSFVKDKCNIQN